MKRITISKDAMWNYARTVHLLGLKKIEHCASDLRKRGWDLKVGTEQRKKYKSLN